MKYNNIDIWKLYFLVFNIYHILESNEAMWKVAYVEAKDCHIYTRTKR
jgi:hypothetical protein